MRVIFFGTPSFSAEILSHLFNQPVDIVAVVTMPDRPKGRSKQPQPSPVKLLALEHIPSIPLLQPEKASTPETIAELKVLNPDLFIVVGYGEILSSDLLEVPRLAAVNIHTSLLPKYRGAAPIQRAIMAGEPEMGITVMKMNPRMDAGDMLSQASAPITSEMHFPEVEELLCKLAKEEIVRVVQQFESGSVVPQQQDGGQVTLAPKIRVEECVVSWNWRASRVHNQIRALTPKSAPSVPVVIDGKPERMKIYRSSLREDVASEPGVLVEFSKHALIVGCFEGGVAILELQLEGKKRVTAQQFYAGYGQKRLEFPTS